MMLSGSHPVCGSAPMSTNSAAVRAVSVEPETVFLRARYSSRPFPPPSITLVLNRTSMFSAASISVIKYSDMLAASEGPRTSSVTLEAYLDRCITACPAELPPPQREPPYPRWLGPRSRRRRRILPHPARPPEREHLDAGRR